jgi:hypothetical protein
MVCHSLLEWRVESVRKETAMFKANLSFTAKVQYLCATLLLAAGTAALVGSPQPFEQHAYAQQTGGCPGPYDDPCPEDYPYCCSDGMCHDCPCEEE